MGERKVLNKYYPPDFDPSKIPRRKMDKQGQIKVRMMLPMSIQCTTCGNFIYKGTKFNSRKEDVPEDTYLGIRVFRFYFKCSRCSAEMTMKTDPKNSDYIVENGASRNYEPWKESDAVGEAAEAEREKEEQGDAMKALENRTLDSKHEMDVLSALDEMKSLNARHSQVSTDDALKALRAQAERQAAAEGGSSGLAPLEEEDEEEIKKFVLNSSQAHIKRIESDSDSDGGGAGSGAGGGKKAAAGGGGGKRARSEFEGSGSAAGGPSASAAAAEEEGGTAFDLGKKPKPPAAKAKKPEVGFGVRAAGIKVQAKPKAAAAPGGLAMLGAYGSDDSTSD